MKESRNIRLADTGEGTITVTMGNQHAQVIVKVNDRDSGIDSEISPLLSKFSLQSFKATGLGLFVAKSIIEASHNARYWKRMIIHTQKKMLALLLLFQLSSTIKC